MPTRKVSNEPPMVDNAGGQEFPVRRVGLSANVGKTIEGIQSQLLKVQTHD